MQKATTLYCFGNHKVAQAEQQSTLTAQPNYSTRLREEAIDNFRQAAALDQEDPSGWELAAVQAEAIYDRPNAIEFWHALAKAYEGRGDVLQQSRAMYGEARNYWERSKDPAIAVARRDAYCREARILLEGARERLRQRTDLDWTKQFAQCCELIGRVRIDLDTLPSALIALREAKAAFANLNDAISVSRVDGVIDEIEHQRPRDAAATISVEEPNYALAQAYERLGKAFIKNDDDLTARSKAKRNLHIALGYLEGIEPRPTSDIQRVEQLLSDPWLSGAA